VSASVGEREAPASPVESDYASVTASVAADPEGGTRRASLKRRAAGLGAVPPTPVTPATAYLEDLDSIEAAADLAGELERALAEAAESNELLRRDLGIALDDLARATADGKRLQERVERLELDARDRAAVVQDFVREMELLEGERDSALTQASDATLAIEELTEKIALTDRRVHEVERALNEAHARNRRFEEAVQTHVAQRAALRAEVDGLRRERDGMVSRIAELEREREDLTRSRRALDEVHRALSEARQRAQRIRPR